MSRIEDIEDFQSVKHINIRTLLSNIDNKKLNNFVIDINELSYKNRKDFIQKTRDACIKYGIKPKNAQISYVYKTLLEDHKIVRNKSLEECLVTKKCRALSGVLVITITASPYPNGSEFTCRNNCYMCPDQPGMPRSYLEYEPAILRAKHNDFNIIKQFVERASTSEINGHPVDKIEIIILGGTWSDYPIDYQETCIRDVYYAANTYYQINKRDPLSLQEEKSINENTSAKIIGLTLETRPDYINQQEIERFISYGVTRVQLGIQHTNNKILKKINRRCYLEDSINAIKLLLDSGFKIIIHLMPLLPDATPDIDIEMFKRVIYSDDLQVQEWKIYPTSVAADPTQNSTFSVIEKWYKDGKYQPYSLDELKDVIIYAKERVPRHIRIARVFRDIPMQYIIGGADVPNIRQNIHRDMKENGRVCQCIRCHEVRNRKCDFDKAEIYIDKYKASGGYDHFIYYETRENDERFLHGFIRLRLSPDAGICLPTLKKHALILELHVYGQIIPTGKGKRLLNKSSQNRGVGGRLLKKAEEIAIKNGYKKMAIRSGVGVRNYYRKKGYYLEDEFMKKDLYTVNFTYLKTFLIMIMFVLILFLRIIVY